MKARYFIAALILIICILTFMSCTDSEKDLVDEIPSATEQVTETPSSRTIVISAAGDCTFATDEYAGQVMSFVEAESMYGASYFMQNVRYIFENDDLTIVNFEGTLSENGERADKSFAFRGKPSYAEILTGSSVEAACLSNNHSHDYGEISYTDTYDILESNGITTYDSSHVKYYEVNGIKVGLVGINYLNDVDKTKLDSAMAEVKSGYPDIIIVSIHWGIEKATEPNEEQIEAGHRAIDLGADLVLGTHPHVLQGIEQYNGGVIAYSLGNFCFGGNDSPADMDTIIYRQAFTIDASGNKTTDITVVPCTISSDYMNGLNNYQPTPATGEKHDSIVEKMESYNQALGGIQINYD